MPRRWSHTENCVVDLDLYEYSDYAGDEDEMESEYVYRLNDKDWNDFVDMLESPAKDMPKLKELMSRKAPWEDEE